MDVKRFWHGRMAAMSLVAVLLGAILHAGTIVLDPYAAPHPVLETVVHALDAQGIDVVRGQTALVELGDRPRITPLAGMPTDRPVTDLTNRPWMRSFAAGHNGALAAVQTKASRAVNTVDRFLQTWASAPKESRVFLSFTAADADAARAAARALNQNGYVTFLFLNDANQPEVRRRNHRTTVRRVGPSLRAGHAERAQECRRVARSADCQSHGWPGNALRSRAAA